MSTNLASLQVTIPRTEEVHENDRSLAGLRGGARTVYVVQVPRSPLPCSLTRHFLRDTRWTPCLQVSCKAPGASKTAHWQLKKRYGYFERVQQVATRSAKAVGAAPPTLPRCREPRRLECNARPADDWGSQEYLLPTPRYPPFPTPRQPPRAAASLPRRAPHRRKLLGHNDPRYLSAFREELQVYIGTVVELVRRDCDALNLELGDMLLKLELPAASDASTWEQREPMGGGGGAPISMDGFLRKQGGWKNAGKGVPQRKWRQRWFVLTGSSLHYYTDQSLGEYKGVLQLRGAQARSTLRDAVAPVERPPPQTLAARAGDQGGARTSARAHRSRRISRPTPDPNAAAPTARATLDPDRFLRRWAR